MSDSSRPTALVAGADGLLGRALARELAARGLEVIETTRRRDSLSERRVLLDLDEPVAGWRPPCDPDIAFLCAGVTSLDRCKAEPAGSASVNVDATAALARALVERGAFVVFPSTGLVFDGSRPFRDARETSPRTEYGRQKAEAETRLAAIGRAVAIVRLTKVLGPGSPPHPEQWARALRAGEQVRPLSDLVLAPIALAFAVEALYRVALRRSHGVTQVSASRDVTWADVAGHIARRVGAPPGLVRPASSREAGIDLEAVPAYATLDATRLERELLLAPPDPWAAVDSVIEL